MSLPFDAIVLRRGGELQPITIADLDSLPVLERISAILEGRLRFYAEGVAVDLRTALGALRERATAKSRVTVNLKLP
jgi:hypothetical protein